MIPVLYHQMVTMPLALAMAAFQLDLENDLELSALEDARLATILEILYLESLPGKGNISLGKMRKPHSIPANVNEQIFEQIFTTDERCMAAISLTILEFERLLVPFILKIHNSIGGDNQHMRKLSIRQRLVVILWFRKNSTPLRLMELIFSVSKTSIHDDLLFCAPLLNQVTIELLAVIAPTRAQRDAQRLLLPPFLQGTGLCFFADSTKVTNIDTIDPNTSSLNWDQHKGFGSIFLHITDLLGNTIAFERRQNGNLADVPGTYTKAINVFLIFYFFLIFIKMKIIKGFRSSDFFHGRSGIILDNDECGNGDSKYVGSSFHSLGSKNMLLRYSAAEIALAETAEEAQFMRDYTKSIRTIRSVVELNIGGVKSSSDICGDSTKSRFSLFTDIGREHLDLFYELSTRIKLLCMRWRGQQYQSNSAILCQTEFGINPFQKRINELTETNLFTQDGRKNAFFGEKLSGVGGRAPAPLE